MDEESSVKRLAMTRYESAVIRAQQKYPQNSAYVVGFIAMMSNCNDQLLMRAMQNCHRAFTNLHCSFDNQSKIIDPSLSLPFEISYMPDASKDDACQIMIQEKQTPFDLTKGPLYRLRLVQTKKTDYFFIVASHAIMDGYSIYAFFRHLISAIRYSRAKQNDIDIMRSVSLKYLPREPVPQFSEGLFRKIDPSQLPYQAISQRLRLTHIENKLPSSAELNSLLQIALSRWLGVKQFSIKHLTLNRRSKTEFTLLACLADAVTQHVNLSLGSYEQTLCDNETFLGRLSELNSANSASSAEIVFCNFSGTFTGLPSDYFQMIPQPAFPHMWGDQVKLKINQHVINGAIELELRALCCYVSADMLDSLCDTIVIVNKELSKSDLKKSALVR